MKSMPPESQLIAEWVVCAVVPSMLRALGRDAEAEAIADFGPGRESTLVALCLAVQYAACRLAARLVAMANAVVTGTGDALRLATVAGEASGMRWTAGGTA